MHASRRSRAWPRWTARAFCSDHGDEFNSIEFKEYCESQGVKYYTTAPYPPQQNGVIERRNQTVVEMARCMLKSMHVPALFWAEAVKTAVYLLNRADNKAWRVSPYTRRCTAISPNV